MPPCPRLFVEEDAIVLLPALWEDLSAAPAGLDILLSVVDPFPLSDTSKLAASIFAALSTSKSSPLLCGKIMGDGVMEED